MTRPDENYVPIQRGIDPKGEIGKTKPQLQLIPPAFNLDVAAALNYGAKIYGPWNWRKDRVKTMTYIGAIRRHLDKFLDGEDLDESGATHLGHIAASCAILLDARKHGMLEDDRPHVTPKTPMEYQSEEAIKRFLDQSLSVTGPKSPSDGHSQPVIPNGTESV